MKSPWVGDPRAGYPWDSQGGSLGIRGGIYPWDPRVGAHGVPGCALGLIGPWGISKVGVGEARDLSCTLLGKNTQVLQYFLSC